MNKRYIITYTDQLNYLNITNNIKVSYLSCYIEAMLVIKLLLFIGDGLKIPKAVQASSLHKGKFIHMKKIFS